MDYSPRVVRRRSDRAVSSLARSAEQVHQSNHRDLTKFNYFAPRAQRGQLAGIRQEFWQTDTAVSKNSWGCIEGQDYKTVDSIVDDLIDIVSKNGALLLNIGPKPDGTIPEIEQRMLREIGNWLKINGEAIYGTRPWRMYGEGPTAIVEGAFNDTKRQPFTGRDIRFTTKGDDLYAVALA
ncbi:MAG: alpha-L-fucosidase [Pyrinomonadaceae bacterium]|nr:alpha-L-fucosidase [Pyrinomonadaceae bacterium]